MGAQKDLDVHAIGNALVDLQYEVDDAFVDGMEVEKGRMMLVGEARQGHLLEALRDHDANRCSGGSAANTVAGVAELGGRASYCGRVGEDALGGFYRRDLDELGVTLTGRTSATRTGTSAILITPDAQRTMLTCLGASAELTEEDVSRSEIERAKYLYVEGYLFTGEGTRAAALAAIDAAVAASTKVALTASDPFVIEPFRDLFWELIEGPVDLLFCNEAEARSLTERDDPIECAREIHAHAENVALTLGANGSILMHDGQVHPVEGVPVKAIDTTGAGDMYAAGILHGVTNGLTWPEAGRLASHVAAQVVEQLGARLDRRFSASDVLRLARPA